MTKKGVPGDGRHDTVHVVSAAGGLGGVGGFGNEKQGAAIGQSPQRAELKGQEQCERLREGG